MSEIGGQLLFVKALLLVEWYRIPKKEFFFTKKQFFRFAKNYVQLCTSIFLRGFYGKKNYIVVQPKASCRILYFHNIVE